VTTLQADYYDGRSARRWRVEIELLPTMLQLQGEGVQRQQPLNRVVVAEQLGRVPRQLRFDDGAYCELIAQPGLAAFLQQLGHRESHVERWQRSLGVAVLSVLLLAAAGLVTYRWLLPWFAEQVAERVPPSFTVAIADRTLDALDQQALKPSELPLERQQALAARFAALEQAGSFSGAILFRNSPVLGANALSLPDGRIVMLDGLIALADDDEQLLAVMAHEEGHAQRRHGLRQLARSTAIGVIMAWWIGDFSHVLAAAPALLAQLRYSRELESEADAYAAALLDRNGIKPERLAEMLEKLEAARQQPAGDDTSKEKSSAVFGDYLATHPATEQRLRALREHP
jgi:Zn-dependent protease with chaperone function